jgi:hypothetical protein
VEFFQLCKYCLLPRHWPSNNIGWWVMRDDKSFAATEHYIVATPIFYQPQGGETSVLSSNLLCLLWSVPFLHIHISSNISQNLNDDTDISFCVPCFIISMIQTNVLYHYKIAIVHL